MVKVYQNGIDFYEENKAFLLEAKYNEPFFRLDAPLLKEAGKDEYAIRIREGESQLLVLCVEPYSILFQGDASLADDMVCWLTSNGYKVKNFLCDIGLGEKMMESFAREGYGFRLSLGMDFMEARERTAPTAEKIEVPTEEDVDELYGMMCAFIKDCGLTDTVHRERVAETVSDFRVLRKDGRIVSFAKAQKWTDDASKISYVYTRDEFRNKGCARAVVGFLVNEIVGAGRVATLNVDRKNPVSNHLYESLGFEKVFSQGVFSL